MLAVKFGTVTTPSFKWYSVGVALGSVPTISLITIEVAATWTSTFSTVFVITELNLNSVDVLSVIVASKSAFVTSFTAISA